MNEELVSAIKERYQKGENRAAIKAALTEEGYEEAQIDEAISYIQREALKNLPGISSVIRWIESADHHTANASPKVVATVLFGSLGIVIIISLILYFWLDPLGIRSGERDQTRETDFIKIRLAIEHYQKANGVYPDSLKILQPKYIQGIPLDPQSGAGYTYTSTGGQYYNLCVRYETKPDDCVSAGSTQDAIPVVYPTDVPVKTDTSTDGNGSPSANVTPSVNQSL